MRVFMLGWEFPPYISGGLGTACYGLTKAMSALGTDIIFVLPRPITPTLQPAADRDPSSKTVPEALATERLAVDPPVIEAAPVPVESDAASLSTAKDGQTSMAPGEVEAATPTVDSATVSAAASAGAEAMAEPNDDAAPLQEIVLSSPNDPVKVVLPPEIVTPVEAAPADVSLVVESPAPIPPADALPLVQAHPNPAPPEPRPVASHSPTQHIVFTEPSSPVEEPPAAVRVPDFEHVTFRILDAEITDPYQSAKDYHRPFYVEPTPDPYQATSGNPKWIDAAAPDVSPTHRPTEWGESAAPGQGAAWISAAAAVASPPDSQSVPASDHYSGDLFSEVQRYANLASEVARQELFDVVHAHDWMTFPAGMAVAAVKGVPLVVHVHSTEFDRSGMHIDSRIYDIERRGMHAAMKVIAVSFLTKNQIIHNYGVDPSKVEVVYNAIETEAGTPFDPEKYKIHNDEKIVLFLGRITQQKGPEYFLGAAKKVLEVMDNVKFVMAGSGDMIRATIELAAQMGIGHKVLFTGFLRGPDVDRVFKMADLYVMPSVSEPFGIAPLEAMSHDVPVLISKQSGVSEVLHHALKVDFWDTTEMANKIVAVLKHPPLANTLREHGSFEVRQLSWNDAAQACVEVYDQARSMVSGAK